MKLKYLSLILLSLVIISCNEENNLLVNPPAVVETVKARFINFSKDKSVRTIYFDNSFSKGPVAYGSSSEAFQPPIDSAFISIKNGNTLEYKTADLFKFNIRNINYSFINLSNIDDNNKNQLVTINTSSTISGNNYESYIKFVNAFPEKSISFSLVQGCQNGAPLFSNYIYKQYNSQAKNILSGNTVFSLLKYESGILKDSKSFEISMEKSGQYTFIVAENNNDFDLYQLDENNTGSNAIAKLSEITDKQSDFRIINISDKTINSVKKNTFEINSDIIPQKITNYIKMAACDSQFSDSLEIESEAKTKKIKTSINVGDKYSIIISNDTNNSFKSYIVPPHNYNGSLANKSIIRVLNTNPNYQKVDFALGARDSGNGARFSSGDIIAKNLNLDSLSSYKIIEPGILPINVFTTDSPSSLVYCALDKVEAGKSYLLIASINDKNENQLSLIEDNTQNTSVKNMEKGVFLQFVNAVPDLTYITADLSINGSDLLKGAKIYYTSSFATVVKSGGQNITVNGKSININTKVNQRASIILGGEGNNIDEIVNYYDIPDVPKNQFQYRFANFAKDIQNLKVCNKDTVQVGNLINYLNFSEISSANRDNKITYFFFNGDTPTYSNKIGDVLLTLGKRYLIILSGKSNPNCVSVYDKTKKIEPNCYTVIIQQEF